MAKDKSILIFGFLTETDRENNENSQPLGEVTSLEAFEALTMQSTQYFMKYVDPEMNDLDWNGVVRYFDPPLPDWFSKELRDGDYSF